jgi:hypothetical protein
MSGYQTWKICLVTRTTARGPELESTLPVDSPFLSDWLLYPCHRQWIKGLLPKDYPAIAECCQWLHRQCAQNPLFTSFMIYSGWHKKRFHH